MDCKTVAAFLIMTVCLIKQSDAQPSAWVVTDNAGVTASVSGTAPDQTAPVTIAEGVAVGTTLFTAVGTPTVGGTAMAYEFESDGNPGDVAAIGGSTGVVTLASTKSIDFETAPSIVFKIKVTEGTTATNTGTAVVTLTVTDAIVFGQLGYTVCISSTELASDDSIGTFADTDATTGQTVAYTSTTGADFAKFSVVSTTGVVTAAVALNAEEQWMYTFIITGTAGGVTGTTTVVVGLGCSSGSGADQIAALTGVLLLSVFTSIFC